MRQTKRWRHKFELLAASFWLVWLYRAGRALCYTCVIQLVLQIIADGENRCIRESGFSCAHSYHEAVTEATFINKVFATAVSGEMSTSFYGYICATACECPLLLFL